jgi:FG-GAP repeat
VASTSTLDRTGRRACAARLTLFALLALPPAADAEECGRPVSPPSSLPGDQFGCSVASDGTTAAVGANLADSGGVTDSGAVFVFNSVTGPFLTLTAPMPEQNAEFGFATAVDGGRVAVGAPRAARGAGTVYVFERQPNGAFGPPEVLTALDAAIDARFGQALALRGDLLVVGTPFDSGRGSRSGAVYVFLRGQDGKWRQQHKLIAKTTRPFDGFGFAVALGGEILAVGAPFHDGAAGGEQGAVYVFRRSAAAWIEEAELTSETAGAAAIAGEEFGSAVALDEPRLAVGARRRPIDGEKDVGAAFVLVRGTNGWRPEPRMPLVAQPAEKGKLLGGAVVLDGRRLIAGAIGHESDQGAAYLFERSPGTEAWGEGRPLTVLPTAPRDRFGQALAVFKGAILSGAYLADPERKVDAGAVFDCPIGEALPPKITKDSITRALPGRELTYDVRIRDAPPGTEVREKPQRGLVDLRWCRGTACKDEEFISGLLFDTLTAGGDAAYQVRGRVPANACGSVLNQACAKPPGREEVCASDEDPLPQADVAVTAISADRKRGCLGDLVSFSFDADNRGVPAADVAVTATAEPPSGLVEPSWCLRSDAGCTPVTAGFLDHRTALPPKKSYVQRAKLAGETGTRVKLTACARAACDRSRGDDCKELEVEVLGPPDCPVPTPKLSVTLSCPASAVAGEAVECVVDVSNVSEATAVGTFLNLETPGLILLMATSSCGDADGPFRIGRLDKGKSCEVRAKLEIPCKHLAQDVPIEATADADNAGPASSESKLAVRVETDYGITMTCLGSTFAGAPFIYELGVTNFGPSCPGARLTTKLDPALKEVRWCEGVSCTPTHPKPLPAQVAPLPKAPPAVIRIEVRTSPDFSGLVTSRARVSPLTGIDRDPANDKTEVKTLIVPLDGVEVHCAWPAAAQEGEATALSFLLINRGPLAQADEPGPELEVTFDPGLILISATATQGTAAVALQTMTWDGELPGDCPPGEPEPCSVEITANVTVAAGTAGQTLCATDTVSCCALVLPAGVSPEIPAVGPAGLALLAVLIALAATRLLRGA